MVYAQTAMEQWPLWGRIAVNAVILFGVFGVIAVAVVLGLRNTEGRSHEDVD